MSSKQASKQVTDHTFFLPLPGAGLCESSRGEGEKKRACREEWDMVVRWGKKQDFSRGRERK